MNFHLVFILFELFNVLLELLVFWTENSQLFLCPANFLNLILSFKHRVFLGVCSLLESYVVWKVVDFLGVFWSINHTIFFWIILMLVKLVIYLADGFVEKIFHFLSIFLISLKSLIKTLIFLIHFSDDFHYEFVLFRTMALLILILILHL